MNVLFVCTGNTCRSPMAEALLKEKAPHIHVQSAGVFVRPFDRANEHTVSALKEKNFDLDHTPQSVTEELLEWADVVLTMTEAHKQLLLDQFPVCREKYYTFIEYVTYEKGSNRDISDPFGGDLSMYRKTLVEIEKYIDAFIKKIQK